MNNYDRSNNATNGSNNTPSADRHHLLQITNQRRQQQQQHLNQAPRHHQSTNYYPQDQVWDFPSYQGQTHQQRVVRQQAAGTDNGPFNMPAHNNYQYRVSGGRPNRNDSNNQIISGQQQTHQVPLYNTHIQQQHHSANVNAPVRHHTGGPGSTQRSNRYAEVARLIPRRLRDYDVHVDQPVGKGSYGTIFICYDKHGNRCAVKFESNPTDGHKPVLFYDQQFLMFLSVQHNCRHVPRFHDYGVTQHHHYMIMELCGPSVIDLFKAAPEGRFSVQTTTVLAMEMLIALQSIHELKIIHRDIKPDNFVLGTTRDVRRVLMIDFGLSKQYMAMGKHIEMKTNKDLTGTARYVSINTHKGLEQSRRDDCEALGYVIIYMFRGGKLPWIGIQVMDRQLHFKKIAETKEKVDLKELCAECPEMAEYIMYCRKLDFAMVPNYQLLTGILISIGSRCSFAIEDIKYDWDVDATYERKLFKEFNRINFFAHNNCNMNYGSHYVP